MENSIDIACLGSANCDFFLEVKDFPQEGETIQAVKSFTMNGGKGANQAVAAGKLAGKSLFVGQLGKDDKGKGLEDEMNAAGVSLKHVRKIDGEPSGHAYIMLNSKRQNIIIIVGGANMAYKDTTVLPDEYKHAISECKFLLLQREIPHEINVLAAKFAHENKKKVMLDFGGRDDPFPPEILNYLDFLSPNETELERVLTAIGAEGQGVNAIKEVLLKKFPHLVVILKLGADGCRVITTEIDVETKTVNKYNPQIQKDMPIVNTTGAGDCFTAAFVVKYSETVTDDAKKDKDNFAKLVKDCCLFANSCAYLCITKEGAMPSMPVRKDVDAFMEKYLKDIKA